MAYQNPWIQSKGDCQEVILAMDCQLIYDPMWYVGPSTIIKGFFFCVGQDYMKGCTALGF